MEWCRALLLNKVVWVSNLKGLISEIYDQLTVRATSLESLSRSREAWEADVGELRVDQWERIFGLDPLVSLSPSQRASHLLLVHRAYYTPKRLRRFGRRPDDKCPRCSGTGDLIHLMWRCPKLTRYWTEILNIIEMRFGIRIEQAAKSCVLGLIRQNIEYRPIDIAIIRCLYQARKLIAKAWLSALPPTPEEWVRTMNSVVRTEKTIYIRRGSYKKFSRIWELWCQGMSNVT